MGGKAIGLKTALRVGVPVILWCALLLFARGFVPGLRSRAIRNDFAIYYVSALELRDGIDPYTTAFAPTAKRAGLEIADVTRATEPPFALMVFAPLTHFSPLGAFTLWQTINLISIIGALVLLLRRKSGFTRSTLWTIAALALIYPPVLSHFWYGQSKLPILLMLVLGALLLAHRFDGTAGLILAFAGLLRIYPLVLAGYLLLERRWRALIFMGAGVFAGAIAALVVVGPVTCADFFRGLSYLTTDQWIAKSGDNAPLAAMTRLLQALGFARSLPLSTQHAMLILINLLLLGLTVRATLLRRIGADIYDLRTYSLWVMTAIILPPVSWDYDMTLALMPFACIAVVASNGGASRRTIVMAIASYVLIAIWRFSGIRDADQVTGIVAHALRETAALSMLCAYLASYWFVTDSATVSLALWRVPFAALTRVIPSVEPSRETISGEVAG